MLTNTIETIKRRNAEFARDVEYLKEIANDDRLDQYIESADSLFRQETAEELREAADLCKQLSGDEDFVQESEEIERILEAETDLTFEEMAGLA